MRRYKHIFFFCISIFSGTIFAQQSSVDSSLIYVQRLYENGMYLQSELEARRLLELSNLSDSIRIIAEKHIAFSSVAQGKTQSAIEHFIIILNLDSMFELDPVLTSPKIISVFNEAKRKYSQRKSVQLRAEQPVLVQSPSVTFRAIIFPGWEQLHQDRAVAGYTFLGAGASALAFTFYFDIQRRFAKDDYLSATTSADATSRYSTYNAYHKAEIYSVIAFGVIYALSEVDAFVNVPQSVSLSFHYNREIHSAFAGFSLTIQ